MILWDTATWEKSGRPLRHTSTTYGLAFSPDGRTLSVGQSASVETLGTCIPRTYR